MIRPLLRLFEGSSLLLMPRIASGPSAREPARYALAYDAAATHQPTVLHCFLHQLLLAPRPP